MVAEAYFSYWGKATPAGDQAVQFHLLPFHSLDVAACGQALIRLPQFSLKPMAEDLNWPLERVEKLCVFFLALHDLGKFARSFQGLAPDLSPELVPADPEKQYKQRHDTLGWVLWKWDLCGDDPVEFLPDPTSEFWAVWVRSVVGHHGKPPQEVDGGGVIAQDPADSFLRSDRRAARAFAIDVASHLLPEELSRPHWQQVAILKRHAWRLAGIAVLADWLGSNQEFFGYQARSRPLPDYWVHAQAQAHKVVAAAGLDGHELRHWERPLGMFGHLCEPTPLQQHAATVDLEEGPQLFLLEDVTGAGKTEAALILCQRLMQAGRAQGLYFALPSMATANQMYQRVGNVYRSLYAPHAQPSLVLAHGARQLVEGFRQSVLQATPAPDDFRYLADEVSATVQCTAWLADNRKKALLAEVGVGTLDQALLAAMPARHQSLRLLGLAGKVLLVDEVHGYDAYMMTLLRRLLTAHAQQGGSVILLSATLSLQARQELLDAYRQGLGLDEHPLLEDTRYPLAVQAGQRTSGYACSTRAQVRRRVQVTALHDEAHVLELIVEQARAGRCICWVRNTVDDARRAHQQLTEKLPDEDLILFHSRYAMGDRLDIEGRVLAGFGKHSTGAQRTGKVLIGTQVLEQSLDFDVDMMVSDLAPIDLLIQRAGRLQRHARQADGDPAPDGIERRLPPMLYLLTPEPVDVPATDWYSSMFAKACYVYPSVGQLWLGARALLHAGCIVTPGEPGQPGGVRQLVEAVYGEAVEAIPDALQKASDDQLGKDMAMQSQAQFNALKFDMGYSIASSGRWYEDHQIPTRLGDETLMVYLALSRDGELHPLRESEVHSWEQSAVRIHARHAEQLSADWQQRFGPALQRLRGHQRLLEEAFVLPLVEKEGQLHAEVQDARGRTREMRYDRYSGLSW